MDGRQTCRDPCFPNALAAPSVRPRSRPPREALLEINLSRACWILTITTICTVLSTLSGRLTGTSAAFAPVQVVDYVLSFIFFVLL